MRLPILARSFVALSFFLLIAACGDGGPSTTGVSGNPAHPATVSGTYSATTLLATEPTGSTDLIAEGATISIVLTPSGTTTGSMVVPASFSESGEEEILALDGTYSYNAETGIVTFDHVADTFIRDTSWEVDGDELRGVFAGVGFTLTATLTQTT
ncbi:MAG: hypothetical protein E4H41_03635 [Gemmatimonadales bacterium]|jgi:hypothetical protein|nr:MAG: hypothetical protein E4H41_03635 [Gemmatimonadales bacterium]